MYTGVGTFSLVVSQVVICRCSEMGNKVDFYTFMVELAVD